MIHNIFRISFKYLYFVSKILFEFTIKIKKFDFQNSNYDN